MEAADWRRDVEDGGPIETVAANNLLQRL